MEKIKKLEEKFEQFCKEFRNEIIEVKNDANTNSDTSGWWIVKEDNRGQFLNQKYYPCRIKSISDGTAFFYEETPYKYGASRRNNHLVFTSLRRCTEEEVIEYLSKQLGFYVGMKIRVYKNINYGLYLISPIMQQNFSIVGFKISFDKLIVLVQDGTGPSSNTIMLFSAESLADAMQVRPGEIVVNGKIVKFSKCPTKNETYAKWGVRGIYLSDLERLVDIPFSFKKIAGESVVVYTKTASSFDMDKISDYVQSVKIGCEEFKYSDIVRVYEAAKEYKETILSI